MYYKPDKRFFHPKEFFPPSVIEEHSFPGSDYPDRMIWRLMDGRAIWTAVELRRRFGTMIMNDYKWGGKHTHRVYRPVVDLIKEKIDDKYVPVDWTTFTSQHCFGRATDAVFTKYSAEEIREDIRRNPKESCYKYITAVENDVSWLHFDCRNWGIDKFGILFF